MIIKINIPDIGDDEVEVIEILVKVGDSVTVEQPLIVVEGNKASMEIPALFSGIVKEIKVNVGDKVSTGSLIMLFEADCTTDLDKKGTDNSINKEKNKKLNFLPIEKVESKSELEMNNIYAHATPTVRRLSREFGVNLEKVKGTGRKGRILREDIHDYIKKSIDRSESITSTNLKENFIKNLTPWPKINYQKFGEVKEIELSRIKKISSANLSRNWIIIPHVTHFDKVDITELEAFRQQQNVDAKNSMVDTKITLVVFMMKVVSYALEKMPLFNSSLSEDGIHLTLKKYINIGIAVDTKDGLVVPVFKDVNKKGIIELSHELITLRKKAQEGKLTTNEMQGGCFTISSIGKLGTTYFSPIINAPEVAILGISKSSIEPVWNGKEFSPRLILPIALSFDHRVIDGADGARFITIINHTLSDIRKLVM